MIPNASKVYVHHKNNGGGKVTVLTNASGFRDHDLAPKKTTVKRILVYGDSFIEAEFTPLERSFSKQLEGQLSIKTGRPVEVVNAGVVAYGPDQVSLKIETEVNELNPDLVTVAIFAGNDFGDLIRNKIYKLDAGGKLVTNNYRIGNSLRYEFRRPNPFRTLSEAKRGLRKLFPPASDAAANELTQPSKYIKSSLDRCRNDYEDYVKSTEVKNVFRDQYDADVSLNPDWESAQYKVRLMEQVMLRIKQTPCLSLSWLRNLVISTSVIRMLTGTKRARGLRLNSRVSSS